MLSILSNIILTAIIFFLLDFVWVTRSVWSNQIQMIQGSPANLKYGAVPFIYLLLALGVVMFVLPRVSESNTLTDSIIWGCMLGLVIYGVYDITTYAMFEKYDFSLMLQDIIWGCMATALVTYIVYKINQSMY